MAPPARPPAESSAQPDQAAPRAADASGDTAASGEAHARDAAGAPRAADAAHPLDVVSELLGAAAGRLAGLDGRALAEHAAAVASQVRAAARAGAGPDTGTDPGLGSRPAAAPQPLLEVIVRAGREALATRDRQGTPVAPAVRAAGHGSSADALAALAAWLERPEAPTEQRARVAMAELLRATAHGSGAGGAASLRPAQVMDIVRARVDQRRSGAPDLDAAAPARTPDRDPPAEG